MAGRGFRPSDPCGRPFRSPRTQAALAGVGVVVGVFGGEGLDGDGGAAKAEPLGVSRRVGISLRSTDLSAECGVSNGPAGEPSPRASLSVFGLCIANMQWFSHIGGVKANTPLAVLALLVISELKPLILTFRSQNV
jgi:hypothetical protein